MTTDTTAVATTGESVGEPAGEPEDDAVVAVDNAQAQTDDLMQAAQRALRRSRLTRPPDDNAYRYYRQILEIDPGHAGARRGLGGIADRYAGMARRALRRGQDRKARLYVTRGLGIRPKHKRLVALRTELDELERRRMEAENAPVVAADALPEAAETAQRDSIRGEGSGDIVKDFKRVWRAVFN